MGCGNVKVAEVVQQEDEQSENEVPYEAPAASNQEQSVSIDNTREEVPATKQDDYRLDVYAADNIDAYDSEL